jgi:hypothetical protein
MSESNAVSDIRIITALLDPVNIEIFKFLGKNKPFKIGVIHKYFNDPDLQGRLPTMPHSKPGFTARLKQLEKLGFVVRLEKGGNKKIRKKNQHVKWQPHDAEFYEKLEQYHKELIHSTEAVRALAKVASVIPDAFDKFVEIKAIQNNERKVNRLRSELRPSVETLLNRFDLLGDSMKKRALEWALEARYFENLSYT